MFYKNEEGYINLLKDTLNGEFKNTRNGNVFSRFGCMIKFDNISTSFPLITSKKVFFRGIVEELLWFLKGSTNANELKEKNVNIWNGNSTREYLDSVGLQDYEEGELGPVYGWQWRMFGKKYTPNKLNDSPEDRPEAPSPVPEFGGADQVKYVITELLMENSRRAVLSAWNPVDLNIMALPPCHILYIFNKTKDGLCCHLTMRSSDLFLGLPFNIASCALLTQIIAHLLHMKSSEICLSLCDAHIYEEHIEQVKKQIDLEIYESPCVIIEKPAPDIESSIDDKIKWIESLTYSDFTLIDYKSHDKLPAIMK
ncbi:MAG: thymidylate synthase [Candidatus Kapaibacteriota bacterium]